MNEPCFESPVVPDGSLVTCPNGHPVATLRRSLFRGSPLHSHDFAFHRGQYVGPGEPAKCQVCGKFFIRSHWNGAFDIHLETGWTQ